MNRIDQIFTERRAGGRGAVMPFITAGYPTLEHTAALLPALEQAGAAICEVGFPFSDPIADGPVIQASMTEALNQGIQLEQIFALVAAQRPNLSMGLVAMVSYSIIYRFGVERFTTEAAKAGFDGLIVPDLPIEEAESISGPAKTAGLITSFLIAPSTPLARAQQIAQASSGFVYLLARTGITGERETLPEDLTTRIDALREVTSLPIAVGFGISKPEHVAAVTTSADAAIVGSALIKRLGEAESASPTESAATARTFVGELTGAQK